MLALKQFRDTEDAQKACYQALIWESCRLSNPREGSRLRSAAIRIYRYPSLPIVETLGLEALPVPPCGAGAVADVLNPTGSFRMKVDVEIRPERGVARTAAGLPWLPYHPEGARSAQFLFEAAGLAAAAETSGRFPASPGSPQEGIDHILKLIDTGGLKELCSRSSRLTPSRPRTKSAP